MCQFGMNGDPAKNREWNKVVINDDPFTQSNTRGTITFATSGPNSRSTQLFINLVDNKYLDKDFQPIGKVVKGMQNVDLIFDGYGEGKSLASFPASFYITLTLTLLRRQWNGNRRARTISRTDISGRKRIFG